MKEIWKDVVGYEGLYQVSNYGNVKKIKNIGKILYTDIIVGLWAETNLKKSKLISTI